MNPYGIPGIFNTDADQSANSFTNQQNIAGLYPGWGINPNQRTPAYDAPYRPAYQGPNPYMAYVRPSFSQAVNQLYNPFYKDPYWGDPVSNNLNAFGSIETKVPDAAMSIGQNFIMPAVVYGVTQAIFAKPMGKISKQFGRGLATGMGMGARSSVRMGKAFGFLGSNILPFGIGAFAADFAENAVIQPYIRSRQMSEDVAENFSGVVFSSGGNAISGRGLSFKESSAVGNSIDRMGMRDMTFSANQFNGIASMGMRAGLFDDVGSGSGITQRVSSIAAQIKTILAISKDPNVATAIEELSKLRMAGANVSGGAFSNAMGAYQSMGIHASVAGTSLQHLMSRVGTQGQYMYQMNGLTPYLGQLAAGDAYSGFKSASRMGVLSTAQLARMGGAEGATQSALAAQLAGANTMYNRMGLFNRFAGGMQGNGVIGTVSNFSALASQNPLAAMGSMSLFGNQMLSQQALQEGSLTVEKRVSEMLRHLGRSPGAGGHSYSEAAAVMQGMMGMTPEQVQAYASLRAAQTDPGNMQSNLKAVQAFQQEQLRGIVSRNNMGGGPGDYAASYLIQTAKGMRVAGADMTTYRLNSAVGSAMDKTSKVWDRFFYGNTFDDYNPDPAGKMGLNSDVLPSAVRSMFDDNLLAGPVLGILGSTGLIQSTRVGSVLSALDSAARTGGKNSAEARRLLEIGFNAPESKELFAKFLEGQDDPNLRKAYESLEESMDIFHKVAAVAENNRVPIQEAEKVKSTIDSKISDQAAEIHAMDGPLSLILDRVAKDPKYAELNAELGKTSVSNRSDRVRELTLEKLKRSGININNASSRQAVNSLLSSKKAADIAGQNIRDKGRSEVDWGGFAEASNKIDAGSAVFLTAVREFEKSVAKLSKDNPSGMQQINDFYKKYISK